MKFFGVATFMLKPEDIKKNLIRLRWSRVLKKIKNLNSGAEAFGLPATGSKGVSKKNGGANKGISNWTKVLKKII